MTVAAVIQSWFISIYWLAHFVLPGPPYVDQCLGPQDSFHLCELVDLYDGFLKINSWKQEDDVPHLYMLFNVELAGAW